MGLDYFVCVKICDWFEGFFVAWTEWDSHQTIHVAC